MCDSCDDMGVVLSGPRRHPLPMGVIEAEGSTSSFPRLQSALDHEDVARLEMIRQQQDASHNQGM